MTSPKRFSKRLNIYVTAEMLRKLEQIRDQRGPQETVPDVVRNAIRLFIDDQEQIIGSRRHFQKMLREDLTEVETHLLERIGDAQIEILWGQIYGLVAALHALAALVSRVAGQQVTFETLLRQAVTPTTQHWARVFKLMQYVRNHAVPVDTIPTSEPQ